MLSRTLLARFRSESSITHRLAAAALIPAGSGLILGIGDDCAIYRPRGSSEDLLFTVDLFLEDVHFRRATHSARDIAHVALTRSLSDIAAMGGVPRFALIALCVPAWADDRWLRTFFDSAVRGLAAAGAALAGGDLSRGERLACDVTVCGGVPRGKAIRRDGARPGNRVYVSGALGGSALGLDDGYSKTSKAWKRHVRPEARLELGLLLRKLRATAAIDISDGLSLDLRRLCLASKVSAEIENPPVFPGAALEQALHGGEEYELLFTIPASVKVPASYRGLPLTCIGTICRGSSGEVRLNGAPLAPLGHDHFARPQN